MGEQELDELYERDAERLLLVAYALTDDLGEARRCVEEAWVRVLARPRVLDDVPDPTAYVRRLVLDRIGSRRRRRAWPERLRPAAAEPAGPVPAGLAALPTEQRQAVLLLDLAGLGAGAAAAVSGVAADELQARLAAGRQALDAAAGPAGGSDISPTAGSWPDQTAFRGPAEDWIDRG